MGRRSGLALVVVLAGALPACFPYAVPPGQAEAGLARYVKGGDGTIMHLTAGIHSASVAGLAEKPVDLGIGYGVDLFTSKEGETSKVRVHGPYGEVSRFVFRRPSARISVGVRGEMLVNDGVLGWDVLARSGAELFQESRYQPQPYPCAIHGGSGAFAIGVYTESGFQRLPGGGHAFITTAGFTFRWPFAYGVVVYGCE